VRHVNGFRIEDEGGEEVNARSVGRKAAMFPADSLWGVSPELRLEEEIKEDFLRPAASLKRKRQRGGFWVEQKKTDCLKKKTRGSVTKGGWEVNENNVHRGGTGSWKTIEACLEKKTKSCQLNMQEEVKSPGVLYPVQRNVTRWVITKEGAILGKRACQNSLPQSGVEHRNEGKSPG